MIPETRERRTLELYRAVEFPQKWELVKILAENVAAVDSTIFDYSGKLWLFANIAQPGASTFDELHLFHAKSLWGIWTPHPKNPIVSDVRRARPPELYSLKAKSSSVRARTAVYGMGVRSRSIASRRSRRPTTEKFRSGELNLTGTVAVFALTPIIGQKTLKYSTE
jgi:hypothetical protein